MEATVTDFVSQAEKINARFIACQDRPKELVSDDDAVKALTYIEWLKVSCIEDCFVRHLTFAIPM